MAARSRKMNEGHSAHWWCESTVGLCAKAFREVLKKASVSSQEVGDAWVRLALVGILQGKPRLPVFAAVQMMREFARARYMPWVGLDSERGGNILVRIILAAAEFPQVRRDDIRDMESVLSMALRASSTRNYSLNLVRLGLGPFLGTASLAEDAFRLVAEQRGKNAAISGFCAVGPTNYLIHHLLASGRAGEAISVAEASLADAPCVNTCYIAPHRCLSYLLIPLLEAGRVETAKAWFEKSRRLLSAAPYFPATAGNHIRYLRRVECDNEALDLFHEYLPIATHQDASPWERMHFMQAAIDLPGLPISENQKCKKALLTTQAAFSKRT